MIVCYPHVYVSLEFQSVCSSALPLREDPGGLNAPYCNTIDLVRYAVLYFL